MRAFAWIAVLGLVLGGAVWAAGQEQGQMGGRGGMMGGVTMGQSGMGRGMMESNGMMRTNSSSPQQKAPGAASNYSNYCASCHGATGKGDGPAAGALFPKPKNFAECKRMAVISDETLFKATKDGGPSVRLSPIMPAWGGSLTDQQIHDLVGYIRSLCKKK